MLALLPPSSRVTRFTWSAQPAMTCLPTSVEPVKQTLRTLGWVDEPPADDRALTDHHLEHVLGEPARPGQLGQLHGGQGGQAGRLQHDGVAGRERRGEAPRGDRHREVPRDDQPDDAQRLLERHVDPARHRDLAAEPDAPVPRRSSRARRGRCRPPTARWSRCARSWPPRAVPAPRSLRRRPARTHAGAGPGRPERLLPSEPGRTAARSMARSTSASSAWWT